MRVLLLQLDGKLPNIALMRLSAHHRALGHEVMFDWGAGFSQRGLFDAPPDMVYASLIFEWTRPTAERASSSTTRRPLSMLPWPGSGSGRRRLRSSSSCIAASLGMRMLAPRSLQSSVFIFLHRSIALDADAFRHEHIRHSGQRAANAASAFCRNSF